MHIVIMTLSERVDTTLPSTALLTDHYELTMLRGARERDVDPVA